MHTHIHFRDLFLLPLLAVVCVSTVDAKNCKKGIPCGGACIPASHTCHIGEYRPTPQGAVGTSTATSPRDTLPTPTASTSTSGPAKAPGKPSEPASGVEWPWIASTELKTYFKATCDSAKQLPASEARPFRTEQEAQEAGYVKSRQPGC